MAHFVANRCHTPATLTVIRLMLHMVRDKASLAPKTMTSPLLALADEVEALAGLTQDAPSAP
jgi:hypothetical protein